MARQYTHIGDSPTEPVRVFTNSPEAIKHLAAIYHEVNIYERQAQALNQIRATLVANFVNKATDEIRILLTPDMSTHELMMQVLQAYSQQLKQTTPVKTTEATK